MTLWSLVVLVAACDGSGRGCLARALGAVPGLEAPAAGEGPTPSPSERTLPPRGPGVDCPDGLARCLGGVVEVSRVAFVPWPCPSGAPACACPWERQGSCSAACVSEGAVVVIPPAEAAVQLCAPAGAAETAGAAGAVGAVEAAVTLLAPTSPGAAAGACDEEGFWCQGGLVARCREGEDGTLAARPLARCRRGCASVSAPLDDDLPLEEALAILCFR